MLIDGDTLARLMIEHDITLGHGRTSAPAGPYTLEQLAEFNRALLGFLGKATGRSAL